MAFGSSEREYFSHSFQIFWCTASTFSSHFELLFLLGCKWLVINHFWFATDFSNFYSKFYRKINCLSELKNMEISLCFQHANLFFSNFKLAPKRYEILELISLQILSDGHLGWNCYLGDSWINGIQGCQTTFIFFIIVNLHFINWYQEF